MACIVVVKWMVLTMRPSLVCVPNFHFLRSLSLASIEGRVESSQAFAFLNLRDCHKKKSSTIKNDKIMEREWLPFHWGRMHNTTTWQHLVGKRRRILGFWERCIYVHKSCICMYVITCYTILWLTIWISMDAR